MQSKVHELYNTFQVYFFFLMELFMESNFDTPPTPTPASNVMVATVTNLFLFPKNWQIHLFLSISYFTLEVELNLINRSPG